MKVSNIKVEDLKNYLHVYHSEDDKLLSAILSASKAFVRNYTGLLEANLDISEDLTMAVFILASDLYDNRSYVVDNTSINPVIKSILDMHSINLL